MSGSANFQRNLARWDHAVRRGVAAAATAIALFALVNIGPEFLAHKALVQGPLGPYRGAAQDMAQPVASVEGVYERLAACDAALSDLITLLQPKAKRGAVAKACLGFADNLVRHAPTLSFAQLIRAMSLYEIGQGAQARAALLLSEITGGGNVQYAQRRAAIWVETFASLTPDELEALRRDMLRLSLAPAGMAWLAGEYVQTPTLRPFITSAIDSVTEAQQAAFLAAVQRLPR